MMKRFSTLLALVSFIAVTALPAVGQDDDTPAKHAILLDLESGVVLFEKDADVPFEPFSMSKMMTVYLVMDLIKSGKLSLDETVTVSDYAWTNWNNRGSTMFLGARDQVTVEDLLRGVIVLSGNDASVVLAEHIAGTEAEFANWLNDKAQEIGLTNSYFINATGWEAVGHEMSARDLATLARRTIEDFPDLYKIYGEKRYLYKNHTGNTQNRNPILYNFPGGDGLKTGSNNEPGTYGLTASAIRDGRRLIGVIGGLENAQVRSREMQRLLQMGYSRYRNYPIFEVGETVDFADVWLGQDARVSLVTRERVMMTLTRRERANMKVRVRYTSPVPAPIQAGQPIATLEISAPGTDMKPRMVELVAGDNVGDISGFGRISAAINYLIFGAGVSGSDS